MNKLIELIEKGKPFFERISRNKYLRAIREKQGESILNYSKW